MFKYLLSIVLISNMAFGEVRYLPKGSETPFDGYLFSVESELEARIKIKECDLKDEELSLYQRKEELLLKELRLSEELLEKERERTKVWMLQSEAATKAYLSQKDKTEFNSWIYFASGALLTIGAGWAIGQASK